VRDGRGHGFIEPCALIPEYSAAVACLKASKIELRVKRTALSIVGMRQRVDDGRTHGHGRQIPKLLAAYDPDPCAIQCVLLNEWDRLIDRSHRQGKNALSLCRLTM